MTGYGDIFPKILSEFKETISIIRRTEINRDGYDHPVFSESSADVLARFEILPATDRQAETGGVRVVTQARAFMALDTKVPGIGPRTIDFKTDPGLLFTGDAQDRRDWDEINERWTADTINSPTGNPWAYIPLPKLDQSQDLSASFRYRITAAEVGGFAIIGYHHNPESKEAPDKVSLFGLYIFRNISDDFLVKLVVWTNSGGIVSGTESSIPTDDDEDWDISISWDATAEEGTLNIEDHATHAVLVNTVSSFAGVDFDVSIFGIRDGVGPGIDKTITAWVDDLTVNAGELTDILPTDLIEARGERYAQLQTPYYSSLQIELFLQEVIP